MIRFKPTNPEAVQTRVRLEYRRDEHYGLSVFADVQRDGEDADSLRERLLAAAEMNGIDPGRNPRFYVCTAAGELLDRGFTFLKDEEEGEPDEHYCVDLGDDALDTVQRFLSAFEEVIR